MISDYTYPTLPSSPSFKERVQDLYSFDGRIGRQSYWLRGLLLWSFNILAAILFAVAGDAGSATIPLVGIWLIIEVGFIAGEPGENQYGSPVA